MATRTADVDYAPNGNSNAALVTWEGLLSASSDVGSTFEAADYADRTIQLIGTLGVGGEVTIQGSNDGTNWATLTDHEGNDLVLTALGIRLVAEGPRYLRPAATNGDGTTDLDVIMYARRGR